MWAVETSVDARERERRQIKEKMTAENNGVQENEWNKTDCVSTVKTEQKKKMNYEEHHDEITFRNSRAKISQEPKVVC